MDLTQPFFFDGWRNWCSFWWIFLRDRWSAVRPSGKPHGLEQLCDVFGSTHLALARGTAWALCAQHECRVLGCSAVQRLWATNPALGIPTACGTTCSAWKRNIFWTKKGPPFKNNWKPRLDVFPKHHFFSVLCLCSGVHTWIPCIPWARCPSL